MLVSACLTVTPLIPKGQAHTHLTMTGGTAFTLSANPRIYPAGLALNAAAGMRVKEVALHKEIITQYKILKGVKQALKDIIIKAVEGDFLLEIKDTNLRFLNKTPQSKITHLRNCGGALDFANTKTLLAKRDQELDATEVSILYFNRFETTINQFTRTGITLDLKE